MDYATLHDAGIAQNLPSLLCPEGSAKTKIWYVSDAWHRQFSFGYAFSKKEGVLATKQSIPVTHVLVGEVQSEDFEEIFMDMQGERWSPNGEARSFFRRLGLSHTSMSVGDVLEVNGEFFMCGSSGWDLIE